MTFRGSYGVYHSVYDSFSWMEQQGDPTFEIHQAMTRIWALMAFRLASSDILPIYITPQSVQLTRDVEALSRRIEKEVGGDVVDLLELQEASNLFYEAAIDIDEERDLYENSIGEVNQLKRADLNRRLFMAERQFLGPGLPKRPWFRHVLQSPGYYLGYGSQAFPGITQALDDGDYKLAQSEINIAAKAVLNAASFLIGGEGSIPLLADDAKDVDESATKAQ